jgi:dipeptidyl aminopeptidase/acylaminoacyl peptidase
MRRYGLAVVSLLFSLVVFAQKVPLTHGVYDSWKDLKEFKLSSNGDYAVYMLNPQKGDGSLILINNKSGKSIKSFLRGNSHQFSESSEFLVFKVCPQADTIRNLKIKKKKEDTFPKDSLFIYSILNDSIYKAARVKSFKLAEKESSMMAFLYEKEEEKKEEPKDSLVNDSVPAVDSVKPKVKYEGSKLVFWNLKTNLRFEFENVTDYTLSENGSLLIYKSEYKDSIDSVAINIVDAKTMQNREILFKNGYAQGLSIDKVGNRYAFYYSTDTSKIKNFEIFCGETSKNTNFEIKQDLVVNIPVGWKISENHNISFAEDGRRMYFGTSPVFTERKTDTLPEDEIVKLDIWSWNDSRLQSAQLKDLEKDKKKTYLAVYNFDTSVAYQIADSLLDDVAISKKANSDLALAYSNYPYQNLVQWKTSNIRDYWFVNLNNGERIKFVSAFDGSVSLAPGAKFAAFYNKIDSTWYMHDLIKKISYPISNKASVNFYNEESDVPEIPSHYGMAGWLKNDKAVVIYDKFDLWICNTGKEGEMKNLTNSFGRKNNIVLRFIKTNTDAEYIDDSKLILISGFSETTKQSSLYSLDLKTGALKLLLDADNKISDVVKAQNSELYSFAYSDFQTYPDRYIVRDNSNWKNSEKVTEANPQINDYLWGTAEMFSWTSFKGDSLSGILYKPENFDPTKKYPMIVYFYEKNSDELYSHYTPRPSRSVVNFPLYISNGYVIFIPDIKYGTGTPGRDAYDAIVSGTNSLIEKGIADKDRIGLQGQSWGGYQVAYLVTQTDIYACAMAGAAVSNMTSAYGGIRWESGNSRMMQYEDGQSRIGATLWEDLPAYIENSPVFFADRITTPLLLMNNDSDGAVPWTQGIELFTAMKRLGKPCWMLNYNGEEHNLKNRPNCVDLSVRMMQFFDYYLKDSECPDWLETGVPAVWKGIK